MKKIVVIILFLVCTGAVAQQNKKALTFNDFAKWNTLSGQVISNNGNIVAYERNPQKGDGQLIIWRNKESRTDTVSRGYEACFGPENNYIAFKIKQPKDTIREAKLNKVKCEKMPGDSIGVFLFANNKLVKFPNVKSYKIPQENGQWLSFLVKRKCEKDSTKSEKNKKFENTLILLNTSNADTMMFGDVSEYVYAKEGTNIYFHKEKKDSVNTVSSVFAFDTKKGVTEKVFEENGWIKKIAADRKGEQFAFLFSNDTIDEKVYALFLAKKGQTPEKIVDKYTKGMPVGWSPSENRNITFSENGEKLFLGTTESPKPEPEDSLLEEEKPMLDIWSWNDILIQPQQKAQLNYEKKRTFIAVYNIDNDKFVQLADPMVRNVQTIMKGNGEIALGYNELPYLRQAGWTANWCRDYYLVNLQTGNKRGIVSKKSYVGISPKGNYIVWYNPQDSSYYARSTDIKKMKTVALTKMIPVNFFDEDNDQPIKPWPYGIAGWSENDRFVFIYDRYDIWKIDAAGERVPVNITKSFGRNTKTRFRYVRLNHDIDYIPDDEPIILSAFNEQSMKKGYYSISTNMVKEPNLLIMGNNYVARIKKAKKANYFIWTKENVKEYPNLWYSNYRFENREKISNINPQQEKFIWPTVKMVEWLSFSGEKLKGLLYMPENLDKNKKYPVMTYFYERNSENFYKHYYPSPSRSTINRTFYASNGYVVFVPDITYKPGIPGKSAYDAIVSGTQFLINEFPFVDEKKIALQGQSWGGYQTAYLITQTELYAAAMAGAPVSNMTSAYGGIRWQSGMGRMFQYEHTQSRIGGTLWEKPMNYIENSPLFYVPRVKTPLLIMHNDNDGAVPWYQGIELYMALRRLDKPVWMLSYNNEPHNLKADSWANRMDLSKRMFGFFNHYLKNKPMPKWMKEGITAKEKGTSLKY